MVELDLNFCLHKPEGKKTQGKQKTILRNKRYKYLGLLIKQHSWIVPGILLKKENVFKQLCSTCSFYVYVVYVFIIKTTMIH